MQATSDRVLAHLDSDDELFDELEREVDMIDSGGFREHRIEQLKADLERARAMRDSSHGSYREILDEKEILSITTSTQRCVVHFFHKDFRRCAIIDKHLTGLAQRHFNTRFVKVNVDNVPFLVDRLKVKVLPCVVFFIDGVSKDRLIGFEELGNTDNFPTSMLEKRLAKAGVVSLQPQQGADASHDGSIFRYAERSNDSESDED
ncbi:thioredoxin-like protein [Blastocladiella britannica]|nr:thioredoxin-like protein [Blastocladiella britannica]